MGYGVIAIYRDARSALLYITFGNLRYEQIARTLRAGPTPVDADALL